MSVAAAARVVGVEVKLGVAFAATMALVGCHPAPVPVPIPYDAEAGMDDCEMAWRRLEQLGCPEAASEAGVPFAKACHDDAEVGINMHPECVARVSDCAMVGKASRGEVCP